MLRREKNMKKFRELLKNKWFVASIAALLIFFLVSGFNQLKQKRAVDKEIEALKAQSEELRRSNKEMEDLVAYFSTENYKEKAAREQMNLKKEGEFVYSFAAQDALSGQTSMQEGETGEAQTPNPLKWWNYFFNN